MHDSLDIIEILSFSCLVHFKHLVKLKVLAKDLIIKAEIKCLIRLRFGIKPQNYFRLVDLKQCFGRQVQPCGPGHLPCGTLDSDKFVAFEHRRVDAEDLLGDDLAGVVAAAGACMIFSARLEIHSFHLPAHRPVDLPCQLAVKIPGKIPGSGMAALTGILCFCAILRAGQDGGLILTTDRTIDADGIVGFPLLRRSFLLTEFIQDIVDFLSLLDSFYHIFGVSAASVILALAAGIDPDPESCQGSLKFFLKMLCVRTTAAKWILYVHVGLSDILLQFRSDIFHVYRNLTETVKLIPGKKKTGLFPLFNQSFIDKITGCNITEISDMDGSGGADSRGAYILFFIRISLDDIFRNLLRPMHCSSSCVLSCIT